MMSAAPTAGFAWFILFASLLSFPFVLVHELGHAAAQLALADGPVEVRVGRSPGWWRGQLGRLKLELNPIPALGKERAGTSTTTARLSPRARLIVVLAGPAAQILAGAALLPVFADVDGTARTVTGAAILADLVTLGLNLVPRQEHGHANDGLRALEALREVRRPDDFRERMGRFTKLASDNESAVRTHERASVLAHVLRVVGVAPDAEEPVRAMAFRAAFAGWCWRHVQPEREPGISVRIALDRARSPESDAMRTFAQVAETLARGTWDPARRPGREGPKERAENARVAAALASEVGKYGLSREQALGAFRYGIAVHDVEQVAGTI